MGSTHLQELQQELCGTKRMFGCTLSNNTLHYESHMCSTCAHMHTCGDATARHHCTACCVLWQQQEEEEDNNNCWCVKRMKAKVPWATNPKKTG